MTVSVDRRGVAPDVEVVPVAPVLLFDVEVLVVDRVGRTFDLDVAARAERDALALGQLEHEFLDEGRDVVVRADLARPALDAEDLVRNLDLHVLLDLHLAGEAAALAGFAAIDVPRLGRENRAAALVDRHLQTPQVPWPPQAEGMKI